MEHNCPHCGTPMHVYTCLRTQLAECKNSDCTIFEVTLEVGAHEQLSAEDIATWRRVNERIKKAVDASKDGAQ